MFDRLFSRVYDWSARHARVTLLGLLVVAVLSALGLWRMEFDDKIEDMLPTQPDIQRSLRFLREAQLSDKVVLSVMARHAGMSRAELIDAADALAAALPGDLVSRVVSTVVSADVMSEVSEFAAYIPQLVGAERLKLLEGELTDANVVARVRSIYTRILSPGGEFMLPLFRQDPMDIARGLLSSLQSLVSSLPYRAEIVQGHMVSRDGRGVLLVLRTPVRVTDGVGSRRLLAHIARCVRAVSSDVAVSVIAAHRHVVSNENVIRADVQRTCVVAALAFVLLLLPFSRDARVGLIMLMPLFAVLVAINLTGLFLGRLSYFMAGLGAVVAGIAVDYGIHTYVAKMLGGAAAVKMVARPVLVSALTTMGVFAALFFSSLPAYSELACFAILSILICVLLSLFILPQLVAERPPRRAFRMGRRWDDPRERCLVLGVWVVVLVVAVLSLPHVVVDNDLRHFDGSERSVFEDEARFHRMWGGQEQPAILVAEGRTFDDALRESGEIAARMQASVEGEAVATLAAVWRPRDVRERNLAAWTEFWRSGAEERLRTRLSMASEKYDFVANMFAPFWDGLYASRVSPGLPSESKLSQYLRERFIVTRPDKVMVLSYFRDTVSNVEAASAIVAQRPSAYVVSRQAIARSISEVARSEMLRLSSLAAALILVLVFALLRDTRLVALSLIPVVTSMLCMLAILAALRMPLTAPSALAVLVVIGLSIDYGVFMVYQDKRSRESGLPAALALSAATTIAGAGSLLLAQHPVMFSIGVIVTSGVLAAYLSAVLVIPAANGRSGCAL